MSNKIKIGKKKKSKKKDAVLPDDIGKDKYYERHSYKAPETKQNKTYRIKTG